MRLPLWLPYVIGSSRAGLLGASLLIATVATVRATDSAPPTPRDGSRVARPAPVSVMPGPIQIGPSAPALPYVAEADTLPAGSRERARPDLGRSARVDRGRTTIAPYPIPGDRSSDPVGGPRTLNVPKSGMLTVAPLPVPNGSAPDPGGRLQFRGERTAPDSATVDLPRDGVPSGSMVLPRFLSGPPVVYPEAARRDGVQGTVLVRVEVLTDGRVGRMRVERGEPRLRHAALQSLRSARFEPGTVDGQPAAMWTTVPVTFTLH